MILDTSAIVAVLLREQGYEALANAVTSSLSVSVGTPTLVESELVLVGRLGYDGRSIVGDLVNDYDIRIAPFSLEHWRAAGSAFVRFGKGRHPAGLNYGDCMAYATARLAEEPLLCLGNDFAKTDLQLVSC